MISSLIFKASKTAGLREISEALLDEMNRRFEFMLDIRHPNFDIIFVLATALDPNLKIFVSAERQQIIRSRFIGLMDQLVIHFSILIFLKGRNSSVISLNISISLLFTFQGVLDPPKQESTDVTRTPTPSSDDVMEEGSVTNQASSTQPRSDTRSLGVTGFKHLFAKYLAEKAELSRPSDQSAEVTEESLRIAEIERQMLDYLGMKIPPVMDELGNVIKIDQIVFWQEHSARFPDLLSLALTMAAIPASSAASERLFS